MVKIHLIVTCVSKKDKNMQGPKISDIANFEDMETCYLKWKKLIEEQIEKENVCIARDLYKGPMWNSALSAEEVAIEVGRKKGLDIEFWVISAGMGLINADDKICRYGATFKKDKKSKDESIPLNFISSGRSKSEINRLWWKHLIASPIEFERNKIRSLSKLFESLDKISYVVISAGEEYFDAIYDDLNSIRDLKSKNIFLISPKRECVPSIFQPYIKKIEDRSNLMGEIGGNLVSLNNNYATKIIREEIGQQNE